MVVIEAVAIAGLGLVQDCSLWTDTITLTVNITLLTDRRRILAAMVGSTIKL